MASKSLEELLRERIGLQADSLGAGAIQAAFRARSSACGIADPDTYALHLQTHREEFDRFVDEIVVSETWFFRDLAAFDFLRQHFASRSNPLKPYRVLSVPCATGQEPYSIAMALLDAAPDAGFEVRAVEISKAALQAAHKAVYTKLSFRGMAPGYKRYFEETLAGLRVIAEVRQRVQFEYGNVLDPMLYAGQHFDAVFCRNLLIYLDRAARQSALTNLQRLMSNDGVLFVGNAEGSAALEHGFCTLDTNSFAFAKPSSRPSPPRVSSKPVARAPRPSAAMTKTLQGYAAPKQAAPRAPAPAAPRAAPVKGLDEARGLADRGDLNAARKCCEAYLTQTEPTAEGYCLLGVLHQAAGNATEALRSFGRALYLDANHHESLVHSALLHERAGNVQEAAQLRKRAERSLRKRGLQ